MNQKNVAKIFVLTDLLLQEVDCAENEKQTPIGRELQAKLTELANVLEPIVDKFYAQKGVSKSTFYLTMQNKFNYIFNKEYK